MNSADIPQCAMLCQFHVDLPLAFKLKIIPCSSRGQKVYWINVMLQKKQNYLQEDKLCWWRDGCGSINFSYFGRRNGLCIHEPYSLVNFGLKPGSCPFPNWCWRTSLWQVFIHGYHWIVCIYSCNSVGSVAAISSSFVTGIERNETTARSRWLEDGLP